MHPSAMSSDQVASLRNIAALENCDNPDVECWDRTGSLEIAGLVSPARTIDGRAGGWRHVLTPAGHTMLRWLREAGR